MEESLTSLLDGNQVDGLPPVSSSDLGVTSEICFPDYARLVNSFGLWCVFRHRCAQYASAFGELLGKSGALKFVK